MLINGEKYACDACVRGHRVSNCTHSERPLQHIAKKGRPVSQCTHCRSLRKARSAHVKCDCGEKTHSKGTCTHAKEGDLKTDICCCSHGGRCSCALKKEHLDPVPESDSDETSSSAAGHVIPRPRAKTAQSDTSLTVFTNGHHKPAHKHNNMAHKCGLPYVVPRAHSIHGPSPSGLANRSVDSLPHTNTIDALHGDSHIKDSMVSAQQEQRMVKSEQGSPQAQPTAEVNHFAGHLTPLDTSNFDFSNDQSFMNLESFAAMPENDQPIFSAGLSAASVDWSHYDGLDFNSDSFATSAFSQAPSFTGFDFSSIDQPALTTTSTSGEISEVEDFGTMSNAGTSRAMPAPNQQYGSEFDASDFGDHEGYRLSTASSYIGLPQAQLLANNNLDNLSVDDFLKGLTTTGTYIPNVAATAPIQEFPSTTFAEETKFLPLTAPLEDPSMMAFTNDGLWMDDYSNIINTSANQSPEHNPWSQQPQ